MVYGQEKKPSNFNKVFLDSTYYNYKEELETAKKTSSVINLSKKHLQLGDFFHTTEVYTEAIEQYTFALDIAKNNQLDSLQVVLNNRIGEIYLELRNYDKAKLSLEESVVVSRKNNFIKVEAIAEELLGTCYEKESNYLKALEHQEQSLSLFKQIDEEEGIAIVNENIGSIYEDLNQFEKAHDYFLKAYYYFFQKNSKRQVNVLNNLGDVYRKTNRFEEALLHTQKALSLAKKFNETHQIVSAYKDLAKTYAFLNEYQKAYEYMFEFNALQEEEFYNQNFRQLNALQTIYETEQKEAQIALLTQQNTINEANQNLMLFGGSTVLLLSGVSFLFVNRKRNEKNQLQEYEQRMLQAELEKKAIEEKKLQDEIKLKTASLSKYSLNIAQKNKLISDLSSTLKNMSDRSKMDTQKKIKDLAKELDFALQQEDEWDEFMSFFEEVHPQFFKDVSVCAISKLTSAELRLAMLLRLNLSSKEIASILRVTPDSVRVARYRLRKKLPIKSKQELVHFLMNL